MLSGEVKKSIGCSSEKMRHIKHHILKDEQLTSRCFYCNEKITKEKWKSEFESYFHYKVAECPKCNKTNRIRVRFYGSGHDKWADGLEERLVASEKK